MSTTPAAPTDEIQNGEIVGRRAFGDDKKVFLQTHPFLHYKLRVFTDTRPGGVSVDRLGVGQYEKKRIEFLDPLGVEMGRSRRLPFRGWAQFRVEEFREYTSKTDPVGERNPFHAEISREGFPTEAAKRTLAYTMCMMASELEFVYSVANHG